jgi:HEAT repeat protein
LALLEQLRIGRVEDARMSPERTAAEAYNSARRHLRALYKARNVDALVAELRSPVELPPIAAPGFTVTLSIRGQAADYLGRLKAREAMPQLIELLRADPTASVRANAARALAEIGAPEALNPLIETLGDVDVATRSWAALSLGRLGAKSSVPPLIALLRGEGDARVRTAAARALSDLGDPRALEPLKLAQQREQGFGRRLRFALYRCKIRLRGLRR